MVTFDGAPYPTTVIYLKVAGNREITSIPMVEAMSLLTNVSYDYQESNRQTEKLGEPSFVFKGDTPAAKNKTYVVTKTELIQRLNQDIYNGKPAITDLAVQPEDELMISEVQKLITI